MPWLRLHNTEEQLLNKLWNKLRQRIWSIETIKPNPTQIRMLSNTKKRLQMTSVSLHRQRYIAEADPDQGQAQWPQPSNGEWQNKQQIQIRASDCSVYHNLKSDEEKFRPDRLKERETGGEIDWERKGERERVSERESEKGTEREREREKGTEREREEKRERERGEAGLD